MHLCSGDGRSQSRAGTCARRFDREREAHFFSFMIEWNCRIICFFLDFLCNLSLFAILPLVPFLLCSFSSALSEFPIRVHYKEIKNARKSEFNRYINILCIFTWAKHNLVHTFHLLQLIEKLYVLASPRSRYSFWEERDSKTKMIKWQKIKRILLLSPSSSSPFDGAIVINEGSNSSESSKKNRPIRKAYCDMKCLHGKSI